MSNYDEYIYDGTGNGKTIKDVKDLIKSFEKCSFKEAPESNFVVQNAIFLQLTKQTIHSLDKNSESADKLSVVGLVISASAVCVGNSQVIVSWEGLSKWYLLGNIVIIGIFIFLYYKIVK